MDLGHEVPITHQEQPGTQSELPIKPASTKIPTEDGGYQLYKAAGKLQGKNALITGGDSGIGRAVAILFAMEGANSVIGYLPEEEKDAQETKKRVEEAGAKAWLYATDIRSRENCQKLVDFALEQAGRINILVNNAAYQKVIKDIHDLSYDQWHTTFDTNIHPYFYLAKMLLPQMRSGDTIINNGSINAYVGRPDLLDYTSTKGGKSQSTPHKESPEY
jgi:NAD(P)-dependent dehydrogenase (short-subunit alcohol dehydrogenase family)